MGENEDVIKTTVEIPDDAIVDALLEICTYITEDGKTMWAYRYEGNRPMSHTIGTLEMVKHYLLTN